MAKAEKIPTLQEIQEYNNSLNGSDWQDHYISDLYHHTMRKEMTVRIFSVTSPESVKPVLWKFCKQLTKYSSAPVSPAEYKRMENFKEEHALIDVLLEACRDYYPDRTVPINKDRFDIIGFYYSIALISISNYRRQDCLELLDHVTQYYVSTKDGDSFVLLRNMQKLVKDHPDLAPFKTALETI